MQMKRYMLALMIAAVAAGTAFAEEGNDEQEGHGGKAWSHGNGDPQGWERGDRDRGNGGGQDRRGQMDKRGERPGGPMDPAVMEQMKANHKAIRELGEAARAETDPAKKDEIVAQLRTKLGEVADLMQTNQEKRLAQAEEHLAALKAKIEDSKANRDTLIDEQVKRVLAGERPMRPGQFKDFPNAKGGMPKGGPDCGGMPPPPMGDDMPPPPPGDEDMPPPPAE
jgi:hypothetical protein